MTLPTVLFLQLCRRRSARTSLRPARVSTFKLPSATLSPPPPLPGGDMVDSMAVTSSFFHSDSRPIMLFDGVCNLCNGGVKFVKDHDQYRVDDEPVDPKKCLQDHCRPKCAKPLFEYQACVQRVEDDESGH